MPSTQRWIIRRQIMIKPAAEFPRSVEEASLTLTLNPTPTPTPTPNQVEEAINSFSPRVVQFSGHGDAVRRGAFAGALAFETKDGRVDTPCLGLGLGLGSMLGLG